MSTYPKLLQPNFTFFFRTNKNWGNTFTKFHRLRSPLYRTRWRSILFNYVVKGALYRVWTKIINKETWLRYVNQVTKEEKSRGISFSHPVLMIWVHQIFRSSDNLTPTGITQPHLCNKLFCVVGGRNFCLWCVRMKEVSVSTDYSTFVITTKKFLLLCRWKLDLYLKIRGSFRPSRFREKHQDFRLISVGLFFSPPVNLLK